MARPGIFASLIAGLLGKSLNPVPMGRGGWFPIIRESYTGAWQQNVEVNASAVMVYHAVFACMTLIASDIAKLRIKLVAQDSGGIWSETTSPAFSPVLRKPNGKQNRIQFFETWIISKLARGNAYILKGRDNRGVVISLHVLDPNLVRPLIADDGEVFYELRPDNVSGLKDNIVVPATEIIHDRFNCIFHPLIGMSPIVASGLTATQGLSIQGNSAAFFANGSTPPGVLTAPGAIGDETAARLKAHWEANYTGDNAKKVAVLGDGLTFSPMAMTAIDSQLIEQLRWTVEVVCSTFHVPPYKIGVGQMPTYNNVQALNVEYYSQCLQVLIESIELCLDEGLGLAGDGTQQMGTEFDLDGLLRMDSVTQMEVLDKGKNLLTPDEARKRLDLKPVAGGDQVYRQQQDFSLAALAKRDAKEDPFAKSGAAAKSPAPEPANDDAQVEAQAARALLAIHKGFAHVRR